MSLWAVLDETARRQLVLDMGYMKGLTPAGPVDYASSEPPILYNVNGVPYDINGNLRVDLYAPSQPAPKPVNWWLWGGVGLAALILLRG